MRYAKRVEGIHPDPDREYEKKREMRLLGSAYGPGCQAYEDEQAEQDREQRGFDHSDDSPLRAA